MDSIFQLFYNSARAACVSTVMLGALATGAAHAADPTTAAAFVKSESGLQYQDLVIGKGAQAITGRPVQVHYTGWLQNPDGSAGKKFDSSLDRGDPFVFPLGGGRVIRGWDEGVVGMKVGGSRKLVIPGALAYGARGAGGGLIPPNATLIFDVQLLGVN